MSPGTHDTERHPVVLHAETEQEVDGRWIAEITDVPGALAYGTSQDEAIQKALAIALRAVADRVENGEMTPPQGVQFSLDLCLAPA